MERQREERQRVRETERHRDKGGQRDRGTGNREKEIIHSSISGKQFTTALWSAEDWNALEKQLTEPPQNDSNDWYVFNS
jgi:hypothetical protein